MITIKTGAVAAMLTLAMAAGSAQAQDGKPGAQTQAGDSADQLLTMPAPVNDGEAYHRATDAEQDPAEVRTTQALNDEIASRNDLAANQERADQAAFEAERAKYEAVVTQATQDRLAYEESVRQAAEAQQRWQADRERWEADVRACEAGDRSRCAAPYY